MPRTKPIAVKDRVTLALGGHHKGPYTVVAVTERSGRPFISVTRANKQYCCYASFVKRVKKPTK